MAYLIEARLQWAVLCVTNLRGALLREAHLQGAFLPWARLQEALLRKAQLQGATLCDDTTYKGLHLTWHNCKELILSRHATARD